MLPASNDPDAAAEIRNARAHSNRSIQRRNLLGVGSSLAEDYIGVIGDGTFVESKAMYLKLFKREFDAKDGLRYERVAERVEVSECAPLAAEHGHWIATRADGAVAFTGSYMAMWRREAEGWKIRSETYVTLAELE